MVHSLSVGWTVRAWLLPSWLAFLAFSAPSCVAGNRSFSITPPGAEVREDIFPQIVRRTDRTYELRQDGFEIVIHYAGEEEPYARQAAQALLKPIEFLGRATGLESHGRVEAYLYPLQHGQEPPYFQPRGRGDFTGVFLIPQAEAVSLLALEENRDWYLNLLPHELSHTFLHSLPLADRWLEDGLAEYLKRSFVRSVDGEMPSTQAESATLGEWNPALEALRRVEWGPWPYRKINEILKNREKDPALAAYLGQKELWRYAAAAELVERWMEAATEAGVDRPVYDLVERIRRHRGRVRWEDTAKLALDQTGRSVAQLLEVTDAELETARTEAWNDRLSLVYRERVGAARTLNFLGLPKGVEPRLLLPAFEMPKHAPTGDYVEQALTVAVSGAIAASASPRAAADASKYLMERFGDQAYFFAHPDLWVRVAERDRQLALERLIATMADPRTGLDFHERANLHLETLTGATTRFSVDLPPDKRKAAAARWPELVEKAMEDRANRSAS